MESRAALLARAEVAGRRTDVVTAGATSAPTCSSSVGRRRSLPKSSGRQGRAALLMFSFSAPDGQMLTGRPWRTGENHTELRPARWAGSRAPRSAKNPARSDASAGKIRMRLRPVDLHKSRARRPRSFARLTATGYRISGSPVGLLVLCREGMPNGRDVNIGGERIFLFLQRMRVRGLERDLASRLRLRADGRSERTQRCGPSSSPPPLHRRPAEKSLIWSWFVSLPVYGLIWAG